MPNASQVFKDYGEQKENVKVQSQLLNYHFPSMCIDMQNLWQKYLNNILII